MIEKLKKLNKDLDFFTVFDDAFLEFGKVINDIDTTEIVSVAKQFENPKEGSLYLPSEPSFEKLEIAKSIQNDLFGYMPTQVGYCYGYSNFLNATEWHTSSEINIATTDLVLILGQRKDIIDNKIDSSKFKAFYVPKGTMIEVFATSLHFCPCQVNDNGFGCVVALPTGTNTPLEVEPKDKLMFRKNKWILSHIDNKALIERGVVAGIYGKNYKINY